MGYFENGVWMTGKPSFAGKSGAFERQPSRFRDWLTADGAPGPGGAKGFPAEPGRYHLYVSLACPWAHRTLILRKLKGLEETVGVSIVHWLMGDDGWEFRSGPGTAPDTVNDARYLREVYLKADPHYTGRVSVPVLWDKKTGTIVNNESAEIIRMFNAAFDGLGARKGDYYPAPLREEIDAVNDRVYNTVNNGVYRAGFATKQPAYEEAARELFDTLDWLEERLSRQRYLIGDRLTEADIRLYTTLVRFDPVYHGHFKCNLRRIVDYENLWNYVRDLFQTPGFGETTDFGHIRNHYYQSHTSVNPTRIVPIGPEVDFSVPHDRARLKAAA